MFDPGRVCGFSFCTSGAMKACYDDLLLKGTAVCNWPCAIQLVCALQPEIETNFREIRFSVTGGL